AGLQRRLPAEVAVAVSVAGRQARFRTVAGCRSEIRQIHLRSREAGDLSATANAADRRRELGLGRLAGGRSTLRGVADRRARVSDGAVARTPAAARRTV